MGSRFLAPEVCFRKAYPSVHFPGVWSRTSYSQIRAAAVGLSDTRCLLQGLEVWGRDRGSRFLAPEVCFRKAYPSPQIPAVWSRTSYSQIRAAAVGLHDTRFLLQGLEVWVRDTGSRFLAPEVCFRKAYPSPQIPAVWSRTRSEEHTSEL